MMRAVHAESSACLSQNVQPLFICLRIYSHAYLLLWFQHEEMNLFVYHSTILLERNSGVNMDAQCKHSQ